MQPLPPGGEDKRIKEPVQKPSAHSLDEMDDDFLMLRRTTNFTTLVEAEKKAEKDKKEMEERRRSKGETNS